jgi:hypothetical protein
MDSNNTILNMEANLLQNRIKSWYFNNVGRDIAVFDKQTNQEDVIQMALRFTNSLFVALDLTGELINFQATIKFLLVNTLRMIERRAKSTNDNGNDSTSFIAYIRKRFTASLNLFRFLISPEHKRVPQAEFGKYDFLQKVGGESLFIWGESLMCFAECSLKYWKAQCILIATYSYPLHFPLYSIFDLSYTYSS